MTYPEAFARAVEMNGINRQPVRIYKIDGMYWSTVMCASPYSSAVLIGEVRRMTPR